MSEEANHDGWSGPWLKRLQSTAGDERQVVLAQAAVALETLPEDLLYEELQRSAADGVAPFGDLLRKEWCRRHGTGPPAPAAPMPPAADLDAAELEALSHAEHGGTEGLETAARIFQSLLGSFSPGEDPPRWARLQHQLGESFTQRNRGARAQNLERAIQAFRAARPGRSGVQLVFTLLGLCQALRQRMADDPDATRRERDAALAEAQRLTDGLKNSAATARLWYEQGLGLAHDGDLEGGLQLIRRSGRRRSCAGSRVRIQRGARRRSRRSKPLGVARSASIQFDSHAPAPSSGSSVSQFPSLTSS